MWLFSGVQYFCHDASKIGSILPVGFQFIRLFADLTTLFVATGVFWRLVDLFLSLISSDLTSSQRIQNAAARLVTGVSRLIRTHQARFTGSSLAANQTADHVQDSRSGLQVSTRHGCSAVSASLLWTSVSMLQLWSLITYSQSFGCPTHPNMLSVDLVRGTVFLMNSDQLTSLWLRSQTNRLKTALFNV